jgi:hypothetical protein
VEGLGLASMTLQVFTHYFLHYGFPFALGFLFFRDDWLKVSLILVATMLVDLDHLLSTPIFQADRCSIGSHYLHSPYVMVVYGVLLFLRRPLNIIGLGLLLHMLTDLIDCGFMACD